MSKIQNVTTTQDFESEVLKATTPVLVDFWAPWCGPCKVIAPAVTAIADEHKGKLKVVKVNIDEAEELAKKYRVNSIPTLKVFNAGKVVATTVGAESKAKLEAFVKKAL